MQSYEKFYKALDEQSKKVYEGLSSTSVEIGTITSDLALKVARFSTPIPKGDYLISRRLSLSYEPTTQVTTSNAGEHSHIHTVEIPLTKGVARIAGGDDVLIIWIGQDPVVVDVIVSSNSM